MLEEPVLLEDSVLFIQGRVENTGVAPWDNTRCGEGEQFAVGVKIVKTGRPPETIRELRSGFPDACVFPGSSAPVDCLCDLREFAGQELLVIIDVVKEQEFWFENRGGSALWLTVRIPENADERKEQPLFAAAIELSSADVSKQILQVSGRVTNTGYLPWMSSSFSREPFALAVRILDSQAPDREMMEERFPFASSCIAPGASAPFEIFIDVSSLPEGAWEAELDVAGHAWFHGQVERKRTTFHMQSVDSGEIILSRKPRFSLPGFPFKVLVLTQNAPPQIPDESEERLEHILRILTGLGCEITLVRDIQKVCAADSSSSGPGPLEFLLRTTTPFDACVCSSRTGAKFLPVLLRLQPQARMVLDAFDASSFNPRELKTLENADVVWVSSYGRKKELLSRMPEVSVRVTGNALSEAADVAESAGIRAHEKGPGVDALQLNSSVEQFATTFFYKPVQVFIAGDEFDSPSLRSTLFSIFFHSGHASVTARVVSSTGKSSLFEKVNQDFTAGFPGRFGSVHVNEGEVLEHISDVIASSSHFDSVVLHSPLETTDSAWFARLYDAAYSCLIEGEAASRQKNISCLSIDPHTCEVREGSWQQARNTDILYFRHTRPVSAIPVATHTA